MDSILDGGDDALGNGESSTTSGTPSRVSPGMPMPAPVILASSASHTAPQAVPTMKATSGWLHPDNGHGGYSDMHDVTASSASGGGSSMSPLAEAARGYGGFRKTATVVMGQPPQPGDRPAQEDSDDSDDDAVDGGYEASSGVATRGTAPTPVTAAITASGTAAPPTPQPLAQSPGSGSHIAAAASPKRSPVARGLVNDGGVVTSAAATISSVSSEVSSGNVATDDSGDSGSSGSSFTPAVAPPATSPAAAAVDRQATPLQISPSSAAIASASSRRASRIGSSSAQPATSPSASPSNVVLQQTPQLATVPPPLAAAVTDGSSTSDTAPSFSSDDVVRSWLL